MDKLKELYATVTGALSRNKTAILNIMAALAVGALYLIAIGLVITAVVAFVDIFLTVTLFNSPFLSLVLCLLGALVSFFSALGIVFFRGRAVARQRRNRFGSDFPNLRF